MELEASDSEKKQLPFSTQYFGHTPDAFVDSITASSIDIIKGKQNSVEISKISCHTYFRENKIAESRLTICYFKTFRGFEF